MMPDSSSSEPPEKPLTPLEASQRAALEGCANMRECVRRGRALPPPPAGEMPDWDLHERRLDEMEEIIRTGTTPADAARMEALEEDFLLGFQADMARMMEGVNRRMVSFFDDLAARTEEKKFELGSEDRDGLEELMAPYQDRFREEMLGQLPIETRQALEEADRQRRQS